MKKIINFSLNNKFAIWILTIMVVVAGLYSGFKMNQETMPDITLPNVSVMTTYPGAAPDEVAKEVTEPIEQRVQNLKGVEIVSSTSLANASSIQIQYDFDTDMDKAATKVEGALSDLQLPDGAEEPEVSRLSMNAFPVIALSISDEDRSLAKLTTAAEDKVVPSLEGLEGVSDVKITGQQVEKVTIDFDKKEMAKYGLSPDKIKKLIKGSDVTFPLGLTNFDGEVKNVVIDGNTTTVEDLKNLEIPAVPATSGDRKSVV